jgi:hypothetical protein
MFSRVAAASDTFPARDKRQNASLISLEGSAASEQTLKLMRPQPSVASEAVVQSSDDAILDACTACIEKQKCEHQNRSDLARQPRRFVALPHHFLLAFTMTATAGRLSAIAADLTLDALQQELAEAERALEENDRQRQALDTSAHDDATSSIAPPEPLPVQLSRLETTANELLLIQHIAEWKKQYSNLSDEDSLVGVVWQLEQLKDILLQVDESSDTFERLVEDEFLPYSEYLYEELKFQLRRLLQQSQYPSSEGCRELLDQKGVPGGSFSDLVETCSAMLRLVHAQKQVVQHVGLTLDDLLDADVILRELCRPFVERVDYHFIQQQQQDSTNRPTAQRIDRLPEWICSYVKEHALEKGPWELIQSLSASLSSSEYCSSLSLDFLNELVRLVQWVLGERNFFRHALIAGPDSSPMHLMNAIEQFLRLDEHIQSLVSQPTDRLLKLMDVLVGGDDELLSWWYVNENDAIIR